MRRDPLLVLRRRGALWGLAESAVTRIAQDAAATVLETGAGELVADEVLGRAVEVEVAPVGAYAATLMNGAVSGLGVHGGACLLVVDPVRPPAALRRAPEPSEPGGAPRGPEGEPANGTSKR